MKKTFLSLSIALASAIGAQAQDVATFMPNLNFPTGIARDQQGNTYVAIRGENKVIKRDADGTITDYSTSGINLPMGICLDPSGNLYVANHYGDNIGRIPAGGGECVPYVTGITQPMTVRHYDGDTLLIQGYGDINVYKVHPGGGVAGSATVPVLITPPAAYAGCGIGVYDNKDILVGTFSGNGSTAQLYRWDHEAAQLNVLNAAAPIYLGVDVSPMFGNNLFYMAANFGHRIYMVDGNTGDVTVVAGNGNAAYVDGPALNAEMYFPYCTYADELGNLWFSEQGGRVRMMVPYCAINGLQADVTGQLCAGSDITLSASYNNLLGYPAVVSESWEVPATGFDQEGNDLNFVAEGQLSNVTAIYTVQDVVGCFQQASVTFDINEAQVSIDLGNFSFLCEGQPLNITAQGADTYTWNASASLNTTDGATVIATPTADETFTVTGTDANGCVDEASIFVDLTAYPEVSILEGEEVIICEGGNATLTGQGADFYTWGPADGLSALIGQSVTASPEETTTYTVYGSVNGCTSEATVTVNVEVCVGIEEAGVHGLDLYPNPTADVLTVRFADARVRNIMVVDAAGRTVMDLSANSATATLDMGPLAPGIYAVTVLDGTSISRSKVVRQ